MTVRGYFKETPILFPTSLLNTAVSGELLSIKHNFNYAINLVNMLPGTGIAGLGAKRFGTKEYTTAIPSGNITKMFSYRYLPDVEPTNILPAMTSPILPTGNSVVTTSEAVGFEAWKAFDGVKETTSMWTASSLPATTTLSVADAEESNMYTMYYDSSNIDTAPKTWVLEGSTDNTSWKILDMQENYTEWETGTDVKSTDFTYNTNTGTFPYLRITVLETNTTTANIVELEVFNQENLTGDISYQLLAYSDEGVLYKWEDPAWAVLKENLSTDCVPTSCDYNEKLILVNGVDENMVWDGLEITNMSELVEDQTLYEEQLNDVQVTFSPAQGIDHSYTTTDEVRLTFEDNETITLVMDTDTLPSPIEELTALTLELETSADITDLPISVSYGDTTDTIILEYLPGVLPTIAEDVTAASLTFATSGLIASVPEGTYYNTVSNIVNATPVAVGYERSTDLVTLTFSADVLPEDIVTLERVQYYDSPPAYSKVFPQHNRLWALAEQDLKVYYTEYTNNENGWFNATTQAVPYISMGNTHPFNDYFVGIQAIEGQMIFHGEKAFQIWSGTIPTSSGDFTFNKAVPVGTAHGNLVQHYPQDIVFTTEYGIRSVRLATVTASLETTTDVGSNIDPTVQADVSALKLSETLQKDARSFSYVRDGLYGFKINDKVLMYVLSEETKGWTLFTGAFTTSKDFLDYDSKLLLTSGGKVLIYANGADGGEKVYGDDGVAYETIWRTPALEPVGRYSNRKIELILQADLNPATVSVTRFMNNNANNTVTKTIAIDTRRSDWDVDYWDDSIWDFAKETRPHIRDKYVASSIAYELTTKNTEPFGLVGFNLIGG